MWRALVVGALCLTSFGCAETVGDIDRSQPNRLKKSDLEGDWFMAQTIVEAPATTVFTFTGETSVMERVRWDIRQDVVVAYRAYSRIDGADPDEAREGTSYTESPIAAYRVVSHFDLQRSYNASTGEQMNVIEENTSDRPWFERSYMRVDWSQNLISNFEFISTAATVTNVSYFVQEEEVSDRDRMVTERDAAGKLRYMDLVTKMHVLPDEWGCFFSMYGWSAEDCTAAELKVRTAFLRAEPTREYEPVQYDDRLMTKFGYFRTERFGFDPWRGVTQSGRNFLINRFATWREVWRKGADGQIVRDADGRPEALPMAEREVKPIVYHVSSDMPEDVLETSRITGQSWDNAFRQAMAAAQNKPLDQIPTMFVVCANPVREGDDAACGAPGTAVRLGDIRYNHMVWVDRYTQAGLLGYGPSGADPLTGELIFGSAYVYGSAVDTYAQYAADLVNLLNGQLSEDMLRAPDYIRDEVLARLKRDPSRPKARAEELRQTPTSRPRSSLMPKGKAQRMNQVARRGLQPSTTNRDALVRHKLRTSGLDDLLINDEIARSLTYGKAKSSADLSPKQRQSLAPSSWATASQLKDRTQRRWRDAARSNVYLKEFADDSIMGLARTYRDERDADKLRLAMRSAIYRAVMEHEIGHTIGLRHNFQGSYDALNYFEQYWVLRKENLRFEPSIDELYQMAERTPAQVEGRMQEYAYSSIMDYGMRFNSDIHGIGRYDIAAVVFGYTMGTHDSGRGPTPGFVEVWQAPGGAAPKLRQYEDPASLAYPTLLENHHYTTLAQEFPSIEDISKRRRVRWDQLKNERASNPNGAPIEVAYMFCSDEWIGAVVSCQLFDAGADPFEQARHAIESYRDYYALTHYHRDRAFFFSESVLDSAYGRYFAPLTSLYQQFVFAYFDGTDDETLDTYYLLGAFAAFNSLIDVLMTPSIGAYSRGRDGIWRLISYSPRPNAALNIDHGVGRPSFSTFQYDSGYYFYDRVEQVGHFWDVLAAMFALTDSEAYRLGVDVDADFRSYSIPWYLFFEEELTQAFNGIFNKNAAKFAPRLVNGEVKRRPLALLVTEDSRGREILFDPETGERWPEEAAGEPIDMDYGFTEQLYAALYGMAFFTSNFSLNFPDQLRVFRIGSGEESAPGAGFEVVRFDDPLTGISYGALHRIGDEEETGGVELIRQGQRAAERYNNPADEDAFIDAFYEVQEITERINLVRSMYSVFGVIF
jgi:hypothetical protein